MEEGAGPAHNVSCGYDEQELGLSQHRLGPLMRRLMPESTGALDVRPGLPRSRHLKPEDAFVRTEGNLFPRRS